MKRASYENRMICIKGGLLELRASATSYTLTVEEFHDDSGNWFRWYGNENWEFDGNGLMRLRFASINDLPIKESERKYHWALDRRPDSHPGLSDLGL
jgi:nuclear transport factor 2 (NTF2) superfamily protein